MVLSVISREFSPKCVVFLFLGIAVFLCGIFWIIPLQKIQSGFDAKDAIKLSGMQSYPLLSVVSNL